MKRILVMGASKGIGLETVQKAIDSRHLVRAFARSANDIRLDHPELEKFRGNALDHEDVCEALKDVDVVVQTLGVGLRELFAPVSLFSEATKLLLLAMKSSGVKRLICITGFGAGDSSQSISSFQRLPFDAVFGRAYADKTLQEQLIKSSELDWTIVRPGVLTGNFCAGSYQAFDQSKDWRNGIIARSDVADFCIKQITNPASFRMAYVLVK
jgi:putative NADH-flavin reductase